jgi:hypothetical protein
MRLWWALAAAVTKVARIITLAVVAVCACRAQTAAELDALRARMNHDPNAAKFITSDIDNFWSAYALASGAGTAEDRERIYQREYLDKGSAGLKDFVEERIESVKNLTHQIETHPKYYALLKQVTPRIAEMEPSIRASFRKLKALYNDAVFPDVYFLIGRMNSGGTMAESGLLIGLEMHGKTQQTDLGEMDDWLKNVIGPVDELPGIVAHELVHYQQGPEQKSLLAQAIREGSADFVSQLISGQTINAHLHTYGDAHEAQLWSGFSKEMKGEDISHWLYQGDKSMDRPADLGYYVGFRITEAYYEHATDKKKAIRDILTVSDYESFLNESHYPTNLPRSPITSRLPDRRALARN